MAMTFLPRFLVLKSRGKYLTVPGNLHESLPSGFLKFDEEQIWSPRVKFTVEQAETGDGRFVHIRSCYNNKYWVAHKIQQLLWIVAAGDKPEEDQSIDSCTLFEPLTSSENGTVHLRHVQTGMTLINKSLDPSSIFHQGVSLATSGTLFDVTDWETLVILPSQISFRFEELDGGIFYLCSRELDGGIFYPWHPYQRFESGLDVRDPLVAKVLFPTPDGNYRIKDTPFGKFWKCSPNWIWADAEDNNNSNDTLFSFVKISDNVIGLRNLGNKKFCSPLTCDKKEKCLNAHYGFMSRQTRLMVEEWGVLKREISDVRYRLSDSRVYQEEIQEVSHAFATNDSPEHESKVTLTYKTFDSRTTHWTNSLSITFDASVDFTIAEIPYIESGEVKVSTEIDHFSEWRVSKKTERTREACYTVVVPPLTKIKVTLTCTKGNCDVPFSYIQRDLLTTGERVTTLKDDGIYTGYNSYNFHFQSSEVTNDA